MAFEKDQTYQIYSPKPKVLDKTLGELVFVSQPGLPEQAHEDAY